jgi:hypothetical protein
MRILAISSSVFKDTLINFHVTIEAKGAIWYKAALDSANAKRVFLQDLPKPLFYVTFATKKPFKTVNVQDCCVGE